MTCRKIWLRKRTRAAIFAAIWYICHDRFQMSCYRPSTVDGWTASVGESDWRVTATLDIAFSKSTSISDASGKSGHRFWMSIVRFRKLSTNDFGSSALFSSYQRIDKCSFSRHADISILLEFFTSCKTAKITVYVCSSFRLVLEIVFNFCIL